MTAIRVVTETNEAVVEKLVHVVNRSKHALLGAVRSERRRLGLRGITRVRSIEATFVQHDCEACRASRSGRTA